ncbi:hypothetical protein ACF07Y_37045 [Streptomyces sp. NPDC016566]|uniref:hypothetical protein n=1 Tax=Streptomyces sp. NPDC016566 TaxID=3364967 RepID=UPI0036FD5EFC
MLDGAGNPITVPKGSTITPTGTVMDAKGHPIPGVGTGPPLVGSQPKLSHLATLASSGLPHSGVSGAPSLSGGQGGPSVGANPFSQWTGTSTGMSRQALASGGNPAANDQAVAAAQKEAAAREAAMSAAEESQMMGRSVATSSGEPMMPPPMGGMPAGGQSGGKRPRTVFSPEDEEVWGTESHAVDGVIGR